MKHKCYFSSWRLTALLLLLVAWLSPSGAWAAIEIDGLYYNLDASTLTAEVTKPASGKYLFTEVTVPSTVINPDDGVTYTVTSIGYDAFYNCTTLTTVSLPNTIKTLDRWAFGGCTSLSSLTIPESVTSIGSYAIYRTALTSLTIPKNVATISTKAIYYNSQLTSLSVASDNTYYDSRNNCNAIIETATNKLLMASNGTTTIPTSVTAIGESAFAFWTGSNLVLHEGITDIGYRAFENCHNITSVTIPASATSIGFGTFASCQSLTSISVASGNPDYESPSGSNCIMNKSYKMIVTSCRNTVIPDDTKIIGTDAFYGNGKTDPIVLPQSVREIRSFGFYNCYNQTEIVLNEGLEIIEDNAFAECRELKTMVLPSTLQKISYNVFNYDEKLKEITCKAVNPPAYTGFGGLYIFGSTSTADVTLYVPDESVELYQQANGWRDFTNIVGMSSASGFSYKSTFVYVFSWGNSASWDGSLVAAESEGATSDEESRDWQAEIKTYPNANAYMTELDGEPCVVFAPFGTSTYPEVGYHQINLMSLFPVNGKVKNITIRCAGSVEMAIAESMDGMGTGETSGAGLHDIVIDCEGYEVYNEQVALVLMLDNMNNPFFIKSITINMEGEGSEGGFPIYEGDEGTASAPYQLKTTDDLDLLAKLTNAGNDFFGKYFLLTANLDYGYFSGSTDVKEFTSIGTNVSGVGTHAFRGIFDGGGHTISGIYHHAGEHSSVFGIVEEGGEVRNLRVARSAFASYTTGAIVGRNYGLVVNCHTADDVKVGNDGYGEMTLGGIVGLNSGGTVIGCTNRATVYANKTYGTGLGGIVGANRGTIQYCLNFGTVTGAFTLGSITASESYNNIGTPLLENNLYYTPTSTVGGFNGYDRYGAMKADQFSTAPAGLGGLVFTTDTYPALPTVEAYEFGLKVDGVYYYPASWPTRSFTASAGAGSGTAADPFVIGSASDLKRLSADVESGTSYKDVFFALDTDIVMSSPTRSGESENFTPIGNKATPFAGRFDGRGHKVSGLVLTRSDISDKSIAVGLFGCITDSASVTNLTIADSRITGFQRIGAIVGDMRGKSVLRNCHVEADVELTIAGDAGACNIGGLAGIMQGSLYGCTTAAKVSIDASATPSFVGGLMGQGGVGTIRDCMNLGSVATTSYSNGALTGSLYSGATMENCYYVGTFAMKAIGTGKDSSEDRIGACQGYAYTTMPATMGAQTAQYGTDGVTAFEHGLLYRGVYYSPDENASSTFEVAGLYYELDDVKGEAAVIAHPTDTYKGIVTIPATIVKEGTTYSVTAIADKAFLECRDLTEVTIGDNVKSIGESAFNTCDKLETVNWNSNLKSIGKKAFAYTKVSNDLLLPAALETIGYMAFYHAEWTKNLALGANVSYIGYDAFGAMYDLATITVDPANKRYASPNDCNAILARNSVTNVLDTLVAGSRGTTVVPEGVTIILDEAFSWRRGLTLTLPTTLKEIENYAFDNALINDLYILSSTLPTTGSDTFGGDYGTYKVLHVQPELVETCKTTAPWSLFQQIVAIGSEGINGITTDDAKATWFTIDGKRIEGGMPTQPGLYIRNGKKVIIR